MTEKEIQEHLCKELLKKIVDNGQNYTEKMKSDLKEIIDLGKSPEEICEATLAYPPSGDGHRNGAVKDRSQAFNPVTKQWVKRDSDTGRFMDVKKDGTPFKGVRKEK